MLEKDSYSIFFFFLKVQSLLELSACLFLFQFVKKGGAVLNFLQDLHLQET